MRRPALFLLLLFGPGMTWGQTTPEAKLRELEARYAALEEEQAALLTPIENAKFEVIQRDLRERGYPALREGEVVTQHPAHGLVYSERHQQPVWTAHIVTSDVIKGNLARIDTFMADSRTAGSEDLFNDYWYSGYDRGHMVASADLRWSLSAMTPTYYYSNISPQHPELNRKSWAELEDWVRRSVRYGDERIFVVTGPVLREGLPTLSTPKATHGVSIPEYFYKVIADLDGDEKKGMAFLMSNGVNDQPVVSYSITIDSVEAITGLDFFPNLDAATEKLVESTYDVAAWYHEGDPFFGEVEPIRPPLPKGMFNTSQARYHVGNEITVCGTVVSTRRTAKANALYLNMDRLHPHQDFYATVWDYNGPNFSYDPETYLLNRKICVQGLVTVFNDIPRISVNNENAITLWEDVLDPGR